MKQFKVIAVVALAGLMMAACAKDINSGKGNNQNGETSVKIQLTYNQVTRAAGTAIADETPLDFTEGHIFFATTDGVIDKHVGVGNSAGSVQVTKVDLKAGEAVIEGISGSATKCYILFTDVNAQIGSASGITGDLKGTNISAVKAHSITVNNINDAAGAVVNVPLFGDGDVTVSAGQTSGGKDYAAKVTVEINSLASRLQIGKISSKVYNYTDAASAAQTVTIDAFKVEGIYVNNFHPSMTVASTAAAVVDSEDDAAAYAATAGKVYASDGAGAKLYDALGTAASGSPLNVAASGVWAYNVFPTTVPHIIIKLSDVKYTDSATGTQVSIPTQFLTVQSFKYGTTTTTHTAGDPVAAFAANNIYTLSDIQFSYKDMTHVPYEKTMAVLIEVQMMKWLDNAIEWNN